MKNTLIIGALAVLTLGACEKYKDVGESGGSRGASTGKGE